MTGRFTVCDVSCAKRDTATPEQQLPLGASHQGHPVSDVLACIFTPGTHAKNFPQRGSWIEHLAGRTVARSPGTEEMIVVASIPTVRRRRLAAELRRLREATSLTIDDAAKAAYISKSALSRIENALVGAKIPVVKTLLEAYGVDDNSASVLIDLAKLAQDTGQRGWWQAYDDVLSEHIAAYISFEAEATSIRNYETLVLPGILQTEDYALSIMRVFAGRTSATEDRARRSTDARMKRQQRLSDLEFWAIIDESVLQRQIGSRKVMQAQLQRLLELSTQHNITLQALPLDAGVHPGLDGPFAILSFESRDDPDIAYVESAAGQIWLDGVKDVQRLSRTFDHLRATSLDVRSTQDRIQQAVRKLQ
jgi:transcriptional regulator with XRE-family HTH domain